jgi:hypothetical protein
LIYFSTDPKLKASLLKLELLMELLSQILFFLNQFEIGQVSWLKQIQTIMSNYWRKTENHGQLVIAYP